MVIAVEAAQLSRAQPHRHLAVPGQSAVGRVVAAGEQALGLLDKRVLVGSIDPCGQCEVCRRGGGTVCPHAHQRGSDARGTLAERITVAAKWVVPLGGELGLEPPPDAGDASNGSGAPADERPAAGQKAPPKRPLDPCALAAVAGDAVLAYTVYARSDLAPREPVVLLGCAPVTRFLVDVLLAKGLQPVVLLERQLDEHGYDRSDGAWRAWLAERKVELVEHDDTSELGELREAIIAALGRREGATPAASAATAATVTTASDAATASLAGRPWKLIATQPQFLRLATRLAGPRAVVTAVVPPILRDGALLDERGAGGPSGAPPGSPDQLLQSMMAHGEDAASATANAAQSLARGAEIDPTAWLREVSVLSVTAASPELILETAALVARGQLDLDEGVAVVDLGDLAPDAIAALGASRALVVRVPQARS